MILFFMNVGLGLLINVKCFVDLLDIFLEILWMVLINLNGVIV